MLVESFNRTHWLDKLRPAVASQKADGPEGPTAPIVTTGVSHCRKKNLSHASSLCWGPRQSSSIRTFGRAVEGSSVSPLTNTMGGLSGGGRGSDTSRASSAPSFVIARLRTRASALDLACGTCCPPFVIRKAYTIDDSSTPRRKSPTMCRLYCATWCARHSSSLASVLGASMHLARGGLLGRS